MAVGPESEMNQIEHRRRTCDLLQRPRVLLAGGFEIARFHRHLMKLFRIERRVVKQALAQVRQISIGIPGGATRSSTWTTWTAFHGTSSCARLRSMIQGVLPPLTAMTNLPRAATALLASSAISFAAPRATDS